MVVVAAKHQKRPVSKSRARPAARKGSTPDSFWRRHESDLWVVVLIVVGLLALLAEAHALGPAGRVVSRALALMLGVGRFAVPVVFVGLGVAMLSGKIELERARLSWGVGLTLLSLCGLAHLARGHPKLDATTAALGHAGGWLGVLAGGAPRAVIGAAGAAVLLGAVLVVALIVTTGVGLRSLARGIGRVIRFLGRSFFGWWRMRPRVDHSQDEEEIDDVADEDEETVPEPIGAPVGEFEPYEPEDAPVEYEEEVYGEQVPEHEPAGASRAPLVAPVTQWRLPPVSLLLRTKELKQDRSAIDLAGDELVEALAAHGVDTTLIGYTVGPTVTRFELELGPGVKVSRVTALNKDIAYALAAPDVRILAPIPGRSAIGVEVPNRQRSLVALGDLLVTDEANAARDPLDVPIGRDISGKTVIVNLAELPH